MVAEKGKKSKVMNREGEQESEQINEELVMSIEKLQEIQDDLEKVNEEASDKVLEVEQKYNEIRRPVYNKRQEIIQTIPDFWLTAFLSHPALGDLLSEEDQKVFKYLHSLDVEDFKDVKSGFYITFTFSPNPYFENEKLTKTFSFKDEGPTDVISTPIKWKEGMDINNGVKDGKKGSKRPLSEESFFSWFSEKQQKELPEGFQDEIAELIKDDLWPNPLKYFNNEVEEGDFDGDDGEDEDKSGDDTEDEEEEEEEEGEDDDDN